mgnify:CR=1 FL=1
MPYKKLEDRTEAVRRFRTKQKKGQSRAEQFERVENTLANTLDLIGFKEVSFEDMLDAYSGVKKNSAGVWHDKNGRIIHPPGHVFFGLNSLIIGEHFDEQINAFSLLLQEIMDSAED